MAENSAAFRRIGFQPRVLQGVGKPDPSTTLLGRPLPIPLVLAPTGFTRIADPEGELAVARAAAARRVCRTRCRTLGTRSIEEVADGQRRPQVVPALHVARPRPRARRWSKRAAAAGFEALVLTVDTRRARPARARRAARLRAAAEDRARHAARRRASTRRGRGTSCAASRSASPTSSGERRAATAPPRSRSPTTSTRSSTRASRGTTSTGCARSGTARSWSRASRPSPTRSIAADAAIEAIAALQPRRSPARRLAGHRRPRRAGGRRGRRPDRGASATAASAAAATS